MLQEHSLKKNYWVNEIVKKAISTSRNWIAQNKPLLITIAFAIASFVFWLIFSNELNWGDLFLNLLAGFIASILTIAVIDHILKREQEQSELPLKLALYRDVQLFTSRIIGLWQEMYVQSIEQRSIISIDELFSKETMEAIYENLDLEGKPNVIPEQNWYLYISNCYADIQKKGEKILDRYFNLASPDLMQSIHHLISDSAFAGTPLGIINQIRVSDVRSGIPRLPLLSANTISPNERDFAEIKNLFKWCNKNYTELSGKSSTMYQIAQNISIINPHVAPSSVITQEKISKYEPAYTEWVEKNAELK